MPAVATGFRRARPAMVSGESSASGCSSGARSSRGIAAPSPHRDWIVPDGAAVADLSGAGNPDLVAGAVRAARIFSEGIFPVSAMARAGPHSRGLGLPRHDGTADCAQIFGLGADAYSTRESKAFRRRLRRTLGNSD